MDSGKPRSTRPYPFILHFRSYVLLASSLVPTTGCSNYFYTHIHTKQIN